MKRPLVRARALALSLALSSLTVGAGCADDFIEPDCSGHLNTVIKGNVRGLEVDIESRKVAGAVEFGRFYLSFPAPESGLSENRGNWLIDFGRNPLGGVQSSATLQENMNDWYTQGGGPKPFSVTSKDQGVACEVRRGALCGGFGVDPDSNGKIVRGEQTNFEERYHRFVEGDEGVGSGFIDFEILETEAWKATFEVEIDADLDEATTLGGKLAGCFYALLVQAGPVDTFGVPTTK